MSYVTPYIPLIDIISGGVTVGSHVLEKKMIDFSDPPRKEEDTKREEEEQEQEEVKEEKPEKLSLLFSLVVPKSWRA